MRAVALQSRVAVSPRAEIQTYNDAATLGADKRIQHDYSNVTFGSTLDSFKQRLVH